MFISHVHEDKAVADAFALLLRDSTAGALEVYSSSDTSPGGGIKYGTEWFQWIKSSVGSADHVVALLTPNSLQRPWILFEAGLGKAKTNDSVFGLALGVNVADASVGPFGVFQNSGSDEGSLMKMSRQLIEESGANPRDEVLKELIAAFNRAVAAALQPVHEATSMTGDAGDAAIFQSIEDLKFLLVQQVGPTRDKGRTRDDRNIDVMVDILSETSRHLSPSLRVSLLSAAGRDLGLSTIAALVENMRTRPSARTFGALQHLIYTTFSNVRPWSRASEVYLGLAREELERWLESQMRAIDRNAVRLEREERLLTEDEEEQEGEEEYRGH